MNSLVKLPPALRRRPFLRAWMSSWVLVWLVAAVAVAMPHQDFPVAAEEYHYVFRSDGSYSFSYDTGAGKHQSFRLEARDSKGRVSGRYGYIDPDGALRITQYQADATGYRANMVIYRKVTFAPAQPQLVGPLPRSISFTDSTGPRRMSVPSQPTAPVGPVPFFSPEDEPVLIIGPLPKPLQPSRDEDFFDPESLSISFPSPEEDIREESSGIQDVLPGPPPNTIPSSVLETILQDNFHKIFRGTIPSMLVNSEGEDSFRLSLNTLEEGKGDGQQPASSQDELVKISQELLQGPEVPLVSRQIPLQNNTLSSRAFERNRTLSEAMKERTLNKTTLADSRNASLLFKPNNLHDSNKTFEVIASPNENRSREKQNHSSISPININAVLIPSSDISYNPPEAQVPTIKDIKKELTKSDIQRTSSFPVPTNVAPIPSLTYLPAYNVKVPMQSMYLGPLPRY